MDEKTKGMFNHILVILEVMEREMNKLVDENKELREELETTNEKIQAIREELHYYELRKDLH